MNALIIADGNTIPVVVRRTMVLDAQTGEVLYSPVLNVNFLMGLEEQLQKLMDKCTKLPERPTKSVLEDLLWGISPLRTGVEVVQK